ncbi:MAG: hypothetical protein IIC81_04295 [Chloroflexi bacterium]|nr:hypothetical protein [Chloroflexota bacterium]
MTVGLDALLEEGRLRAIALKRPVLVSRSRPMPDPADPVSLFAGADAEEPWRVFWCQPSRGEWIVGIGAASILRGSGDRRFVQVKAGLRSLLADALVEAPGIRGVGPLALGGFRFDPSARVSEEWRGYGDGFLVLPRVCYAGNKEGTWITENLVIHPDGFDKKASSDTVTVGADGGHSGKSSDDVESEAVARKRWRRSVDRVLKAIRAVSQGQSLLDPAVTKSVMDRFAGLLESEHDRALDAISSREREVLGLIARGMTNRQIAEELVISENTARNHVSRILDKLGLARRSEAAVFAAQHGLAPKSET